VYIYIYINHLNILQFAGGSPKFLKKIAGYCCCDICNLLDVFYDTKAIVSQTFKQYIATDFFFYFQSYYSLVNYFTNAVSDLKQTYLQSKILSG